MNCSAVAEWPNWAGETVFVVGTGPSAALLPLEAVRNRAKVFVIKSSLKLAPWADALYGADLGWWVANKLDVDQFIGWKFCPCPRICHAYKGVRLVKLQSRAMVLTKNIGTVGCGLETGGGHSGFQAINLAVQFGAKRIVLVGFDMTLSGGAHWHKDYRGIAKPDAKRVKSWREEMDACASQFKQLGVEVLNASPVSALTAYPKIKDFDFDGRNYSTTN